MTPDEARARARAILNEQTTGRQIIQLNSDGSLVAADAKAQTRKKTVLHDPKGEYDGVLE